MVAFRFPHGFRSGPATVDYFENGTSGVYAGAGVAVGKNADMGRVYAQRLDGTLYPTAFTRR